LAIYQQPGRLRAHDEGSVVTARCGVGAGEEGHTTMRFLIRTGVTAVGLCVATLLLSGISVRGQGVVANALTLVAVAVIFGLVNAIIKPVVMILGCVFYLVTLGLIGFVVNALLFLLVNWLAGLLHLPFHVDGFWSAFWGAIIVTVVSWLINLLIPDAEPNRPTSQGSTS
jgi:putative membrane protein